MFKPGQIICGVRQTCSVAFAGKPCLAVISGTTINFDPYATANGVIEYADPQDNTVILADQGGEFIFSESVALKEIRGDCGTITLTITDLNGTSGVLVYSSSIANHAFLSDLIVQSSQKVLISSTAPGWVELYVASNGGRH